MKISLPWPQRWRLSAAAPAHAQTKAVPSTSPRRTSARLVAPALGKYAQGALADLWKRPGLAPRDRSVVTVAALIARNQTIEMAHTSQPGAR